MKKVKLPQDFEAKLTLSQLQKGTLLYGLAKAKIDHQGFYSCTYKGLKTVIVK
jgi:hypothetical protein